MIVYIESLSNETAERIKEKSTVRHELEGTCRCKVEVNTIADSVKYITLWCKNGQLVQIDKDDFNYITIYN